MKMDELTLAALPDEVVNRGLDRLMGDLLLFDALLAPEPSTPEAGAPDPPGADTPDTPEATTPDAPDAG